MADARRQPRDSDRPEPAAEIPPVPARTPDLAPGGIDVAAESVGERLVVLRIAGEIDMVTAPTLADHVRRHFAAAPSGGDRPATRGLVFDLAAVDFLGSAGLAVLAEAATLAGAAAVPVRIVATSHAVLRPLQVTGLDSVLATCDDLDTAIRQCSD